MSPTVESDPGSTLHCTLLSSESFALLPLDGTFVRDLHMTGWSREELGRGGEEGMEGGREGAEAAEGQLGGGGRGDGQGGRGEAETLGRGRVQSSVQSAMGAVQGSPDKVPGPWS